MRRATRPRSIVSTGHPEVDDICPRATARASRRCAASGWSAAGLALLLALAPSTLQGEIYVCAGDVIRVFADDAGPGSSPIRALGGPTSGIAECYGIALDSWHDELWVTSQDTIRAFRASANGDVAPLRTIGGFGFAAGIAVDIEADEVYVGTVAGAVAVYPRTGNGSPPPLRRIEGNLTTLGTVVGLFVDRVNDELYVVNYGGNVVVFGRLDSGNQAPARPFASFTNPFGLVVDAHGDEVFVSPGAALVQAYDRMGSPLRTIAGSATLLTKSAGLALLSDGILLAGNQYGSSTTNDAIFGYGRSENGDAPPSVVINFAAPLQRVLWGIVSSRAFECGEGLTTSRCLFRHGFEGGDLTDWSSAVGAMP